MHKTAYVCLFVYVCVRTCVCVCVCACTCVPVWRDIYLNDIYFSISGNALYSSNSKLLPSSQESRDLLKHCQCEVLKEGCKSFFFHVEDPARNLPGGNLLSHFSEMCIKIANWTYIYFFISQLAKK